MEIERLQDATNLEALGEYIGLQTRASARALEEKTSLWSSDRKSLEQKSSEFAILQSHLKMKPALAATLQTKFRVLGTLETDLDALINKASELETEAFNELLFLKTWSKPLNAIPFFLALWSILRVYIFPGMSLLMPLGMLIMPFIIIRFMFKIPLTASRYTSLLSAIVSGQVTNIFTMNSAEEVEKPSSTSPIDITQLLKTGFLAATLIQSFLQPYWSFQHLSSIDSIIQKKADSLVQFQQLYASLKEDLQGCGFQLSANPFAPFTTDSRQLVAEAQLHPTYLKLALKRLGAVEALVQLALSDLTPVRWIQAERPSLELRQAFDYRVTDGRISFDLTLNGDHALLTGPNRGGKSTTLRGVLGSCLLAHTYGCAFASSASMTPLTRLYACLTAEDLPGKKSRFEREIEFTAATLKPSPGHSLVLLDELYHSTNPPDAELACAQYTAKLWNTTNTISIISTHLFDFVEKAPTSVQRLCCPAFERPDKSIHYTYQLSEGVCRVSSVNELLNENGLCV